MKAAILVAAAVMSVVCLGGCSSKEVKKAADKAVVAADAAEPVVEKNVITELPDKTEFVKIPNEAVDAFNFGVEELKAVCPVEKGFKRLYGYVGEEKVVDADCYVFCVYDQKKDETVYVGKIARAVDAEKLWFDNGSGYEFIETERVPEWSETVTETYAVTE
ncbi:MAG: hypothetical protein IJ645_10620 [Ruminococcus sp.]|nr:hypothetical protein [Ruminococcus sp.]